jgi:quercetin dioxygenase-like cupin family protein
MMRDRVFRSAGALALVLGFATISAAGAASGNPSVRYAYTWTVNDAPAGAWDVYVGAARSSPNFWAGPHTHPGPEYGIYLEGTGARWNAGSGLSTSGPRGTYHSTGGLVHESGNISDGNVISLTTHILSAGGPFNIPASPAPSDAPPGAPQLSQTLYRIKVPLTSHPSNPFDMTMEVLDFAGNLSVPAHVVPATTLLVVVDGSLAVTMNGSSKTYEIGEEVTIPPGASVALANPSSYQTTAVATQLGS